MNIDANPSQQSEEFTVKDVLSFFSRNWRPILSVTIIGGSFGVLYASRIKPLWQGSFEIVVSSANPPSPVSLLPVASLSGITNFSSNAGSELKTQVTILQSPSVVRPVFDQWKIKQESTKERRSNYSFKRFMKHISVNLKKGTTVLEVTYKDPSKSAAISVLSDLLRTYQDYSKEDRAQSLYDGIKYAQAQALIYRDRARSSYRAMNAFALKYGISGSSGSSSGSVDISQLLNQGSLQNNSATSVSSKATLERKGDPLAKLAALNLELSRRQQLFKENDPSIKSIKLERDAIKKYIESSAFGVITDTNSNRITKDEAEKIIVQYQELQRQYSVDQSTLESMEDAVVSLQLERARSIKPWELISAPTISNIPIDPPFLRFLAIGLLVGFVSSAVTTFGMEKVRGFIFDKSTYCDLLDCEILFDISNTRNNELSQKLELAKRYLFKGNTVAIYPIGNVSTQLLDSIVLSVSSLNLNKAELCRTFSSIDHYDNVILVAQPGAATISDILEVSQALNIAKSTYFLAWVSP